VGRFHNSKPRELAPCGIVCLDFAPPDSIIHRIVLTDPQLATPPQRRRLAISIVLAAFSIAFVLALFLDAPLSTWAHETGLAGWLKYHSYVADVIRFPGNFYFTIVICAVILAAAWKAGIRRGPRLWEKPAIVFVAGILSSLNALLKIFVGRIRPYHGVPPFELHPFRFGLVSAEASYSFPSGDATLAFAMAVSLSMVLPRFRPLWWTLAVIVGLERIAANAHYPSDVVAGAALGTAVAFAAKKIVRVLTKNDANRL
jgi:membrane-associated phospholipid phosphatase